MGWLTLPLKIIIPLIIFIIILIITFIYFYRKNKGMYQEINSEKTKYNLFEQRIKDIEDSRESPEKDLDKISKLSKDFFKEYYGLSPILTYLELSEKFKDNKKISDFCRIISDLNYSGNKINSESIIFLKQTLSEIIREEAP